MTASYDGMSGRELAENMATSDDTLQCLDSHQGGCRGDIEYRYPLSSTGKPFPRCDYHWNERLEKQREIDQRYAPNSDVPPEGFDPTYAGERWDEEY